VNLLDRLSDPEQIINMLNLNEPGTKLTPNMAERQEIIQCMILA